MSWRPARISTPQARDDKADPRDAHSNVGRYNRAKKNDPPISTDTILREDALVFVSGGIARIADRCARESWDKNALCVVSDWSE